MTTTRQELYDRVRSSSRDEVTLEEMKKLGFWSEDENQPSLSEEVIKKEAVLSQELRELVTKQRKYENQAQLLADIHKERKAASKQKQKENKERRLREKEEKAEAWKKRKENEILYLGEDVSNELHLTEKNAERLQHADLPDFHDERSVADQLGITLPKLRFFAYNRMVSKVTHYKQFYMKKKSGGKRLISAPMPDLKAIQSWILQNILYKVEVNAAAHGFIPGKSIVTNAQPHLQQDIVINADLKNFFPTVSFKRVKGLFYNLGYSKKISTILALLCTEAETQPVELDGKKFYLATGDRCLPQGAPSSPMITNIICRKMDKRMLGLAKKYSFIYSRYADDMTFSCSKANEGNIPKLLANVRRVIKDENFILHPDKLRVMRKGNRKEVTGVVINEKLNVSRAELKKFRALLFQIEKDGIEGKTWNGSTNLLASIKGYASYVFMVNPDKGAKLLEKTDLLLQKYEFKHTIVHHKKEKKEVKNSEKSIEKKKAWWKFW